MNSGYSTPSFFHCVLALLQVQPRDQDDRTEQEDHERFARLPRRKLMFVSRMTPLGHDRQPGVAPAVQATTPRSTSPGRSAHARASTNGRLSLLMSPARTTCHHSSMRMRKSKAFAQRPPRRRSSASRAPRPTSPSSERDRVDSGRVVANSRRDHADEQPRDSRRHERAAFAAPSWPARARRQRDERDRPPPRT